MDAKLDSRQGQFPATFPDTFKDFFAMKSEDEDHLDLFSNLLEDKVIPHHNNSSRTNASANSNRFLQRRHGGSLRCPTHPHNGSGAERANHHTVGRSNSFRVHRPRNPAATYGNGSCGGCASCGGALGMSCVSGAGGTGSSICSSSSTTTLTSLGQSGGTGATHNIGSGHSTGSGSSGSGGGGGSGSANGNLFCKHIKYCCLHQQQSQLPTLSGTQQLQQQTQSQSNKLTLPSQPKSSHKHRLHNQQQSAQMQTKCTIPVPVAATAATSVAATGHYMQHTAHLYQPSDVSYATDYTSGSVRLGPDGEDNSGEGGGGVGSKDRQQHLYGSSGSGQRQQSRHHQQQHRAATLQKRHSVILERAFDFDASCEESDTISTPSSTPTPAELPLPPPPQQQKQPPSNTTTVLKPILKKPTTAVPQYQQMHTQQQQQQQQLLQLHQQQQQQKQQQMQLNTLKSTGPPTLGPPSNASCKEQIPTHRTLPQPPKGLGFGAYHTKEAVLQRVQKQCGLLSTSRTNLNTLSGMLGSAINLAGIGGGLCASAGAGTGNSTNNTEILCGGTVGSASTGGVVVGDSISNSTSGNLHYSHSNYNFDATTAKQATSKTTHTGIGETVNVGVEVGGSPPACCSAPSAPITSDITSANSMLYIDLHSPTATPTHPTPSTSVNKFNDLLNAASANFVNAVAAPTSISMSTNNNNHNGTTAAVATLCTVGRNNSSTKRVQKSPLLARRRSSSIVTNLLASDMSYNRCESTTLADITNLRNHHATTMGGSTTTLAHSSTRDRISLAKSPVSGKPTRLPSLHSMGIESTGSGSGNCGGVLTFQQAMSGAVSPQYSSTTQLLFGSGIGGAGGSISANMNLLDGSSSALASVLEDSATSVGEMVSDTLQAGESPTVNHHHHHHHHNNNNHHDDFDDSHYELDVIGSGIGGVGAPVNMNVGTSGVHRTGSNILHSSSATIAQLHGSQQRQRMRTSSMPAESRKPRLADTRRAAIHCADLDLEYYRLRSFSITSHGVCNLGDSLRSRRSRSINSVTSTGTSNSGREKGRNNSNASHTSGDNIFESTEKQQDGNKIPIPAYKIAMLGASGVGKTTLTYQFTTSDYICAYDLSLDDDYGQKTVSVLVDGIETDLEIIDHPACEMSTEAFCSTYNIDLFVVVYSVVDRNSFKAAEKVLQYLKEHEMLLTRGAILVGNKTDLERHREVNRQNGRKLAKEICCKFIETSSGLDHNVNELLVGIVAQAKLNPQRIRNLSERDRQRLSLQSAIQKHRHMHIAPRRMVRQASMYHADDDDNTDDAAENDNDSGGDNLNENQTNIDEGIGTASERTISTNLSSTAASIKPTNTKTYTQRTNKRTLNLESILKMGESELEDEEDTALRQPTSFKQQQHQTKTISKFDLLLSGGKNSLNSSPKNRRFYSSSTVSGAIGAFTGGRRCASDGANSENYTESNDQLLDEGNRKSVSKLTNRTKVFLCSVLKFKKAVNMRRRNSSSCSDLFVI